MSQGQKEPRMERRRLNVNQVRKEPHVQMQNGGVLYQMFWTAA